MIDQRLLDPHEAKAYWANVYGSLRASEGASEASLLAPVCHPEAAGGVSRLLNRIQRHAVEHALRFCEPSGGFESLRVLDVGCSTGRWSRTLADLGAGVVGVDLSPDAVSICRSRVPEGEFICSDATGLASRVEGRFGLILSVTVLQHIHFQEKPLALEQIRKVLAPRATSSCSSTRARKDSTCSPVLRKDGKSSPGRAGWSVLRSAPTSFSRFVSTRSRGPAWAGSSRATSSAAGWRTWYRRTARREDLRHPLGTLLRTLRTGAIGASTRSGCAALT
jgi:SAM-dependent methyltransferase